MTALTPLLAADAFCPADPAHQRAEIRNNMFVAAVLYADGGSAPVRIRNMSRSGALIECVAIPPEGSEVRLGRGSLNVGGCVAWRRDNRAGIRFESAIEVADWLPRGSKPSGQQRVDEIVHACRKPTAAAPVDGNVVHAPGKTEVIRRLLDFKDVLAQVAAELADDAGIAAGFPTALQTIDVTAQKLEKLAAFLAEGS